MSSCATHIPLTLNILTCDPPPVVLQLLNCLFESVTRLFVIQSKLKARDVLGSLPCDMATVESVSLCWILHLLCSVSPRSSTLKQCRATRGVFVAFETGVDTDRCRDRKKLFLDSDLCTLMKT